MQCTQHYTGLSMDVALGFRQGVNVASGFRHNRLDCIELSSVYRLHRPFVGVHIASAFRRCIDCIGLSSVYRLDRAFVCIQTGSAFRHCTDCIDLSSVYSLHRPFVGIQIT